MKKKILRWVVVPVVAIAASFTVSSFTGDGEDGSLQPYRAKCPDSETRITVCGEGSTYCRPEGTCK